MAESDGKWQIAFWIMTTICGLWLLGITSAVVANDRIRASEDIRITDKIETQIQMFRSENTKAHEIIIEKIDFLKGKVQ